MVTVAIVFAVLVALIVGTIVSVRSSAKTGMPSQDVLDRATRRARELDSEDKDD